MYFRLHVTKNTAGADLGEITLGGLVPEPIVLLVVVLKGMDIRMVLVSQDGQEESTETPM